MSQFYCWLLSLCCDAKIHNGLIDIDRHNECGGCGNKIKNIDKGSYDTRKKSAEDFFERHKNLMDVYGFDLQDVIDHHVRENISH